MPHEDFNTIAEIAAQPSHDKEAAEVVLAAINQGTYWHPCWNLLFLSFAILLQIFAFSYFSEFVIIRIK